MYCNVQYKATLSYRKARYK